jgi:hypothetical protein
MFSSNANSEHVCLILNIRGENNFATYYNVCCIFNWIKFHSIASLRVSF